MTDDEMTDDEMMASDAVKVGKLTHDLCSLVDDLKTLEPEKLEPFFDPLIYAQLALMSLIIGHGQWRHDRKKDLDVNFRLCQVRH